MPTNDNKRSMYLNRHLSISYSRQKGLYFHINRPKQHTINKYQQWQSMLNHNSYTHRRPPPFNSKNIYGLPLYYIPNVLHLGFHITPPTHLLSEFLHRCPYVILKIYKVYPYTITLKVSGWGVLCEIQGGVHLHALESI